MDKNSFDQLTVPVPPYKGWRLSPHPRATLASVATLERPESMPVPVIEKQELSEAERIQAEALAEINREAPIDEEDARAREQAIAEIAAVVKKAMQEVVTLKNNEQMSVQRNSEGTIVNAEKLERIEKEIDFREASDWDDLREKIRDAGPITNTAGKTYSVEKLLGQVDLAEVGGGLEYVTRAGNLKDAVEKLREASNIDANQPVPLRGPGQAAMQEASRKAQEMAQKQAAA